MKTLFYYHFYQIKKKNQYKTQRIRRIKKASRATKKKTVIEIQQKISCVEKSTIDDKLEAIGVPEVQQLLIMQCIDIFKYRSKNTRRYNHNWLLIC